MMFLFLSSSCTKDLFEVADDFQNVERIQWDPSFAGPLVKTRLSLEDLKLDTSAYIKKDAEGLLYLVYENGISSKSGAELLSIDNQQAALNLSLSPQQISDMNINDSVMAYYQVPLTFNFGNGMELDSMELKKGTIQIQLNNELPSDCRLVFQLPQVKRSGATLSGSMQVVANGQASQQFDLSGSVFNLSTLFPAYNRMQADVFVYAKKGSTLPQLTDRLMMNLQFQNQEFRTVYGLMNVDEIQNIDDTVSFDVLDNVSIGQFTIEDPRLKFRFFNSFGVPVKAGIEPVQFTRQNGSSVSITGIPSPLNIPVPTMAQKGQTLTDSFELNKQTSNFASELSQRPKSMSYQARGEIDQGSNRASFINDDSRFRVEIAAEVPLWGSVQQFVLEQESDFAADLPEETEYIESLNIKLFTENRFPMDIYLQAYFLDAQGNILDSLITGGTQLLPAAPVDGTGRVIRPASNGLNIPFNRSKISAIQNAKRMRFKGQLDTYNTAGTYPSVKFFEDYDLAIKVALQVGLKVERDL